MEELEELSGLEEEAEDLKGDISELEVELQTKRSELNEKENEMLPYKVKLCKYRKENYCNHFKESTSDDDCSDCIHTYDIWKKR